MLVREGKCEVNVRVRVESKGARNGGGLGDVAQPNTKPRQLGLGTFKGSTQSVSLASLSHPNVTDRVYVWSARSGTDYHQDINLPVDLAKIQHKNKKCTVHVLP